MFFATHLFLDRIRPNSIDKILKFYRAFMVSGDLDCGSFVFLGGYRIDREEGEVKTMNGLREELVLVTPILPFFGRDCLKTQLLG